MEALWKEMEAQLKPLEGFVKGFAPLKRRRRNAAAAPSPVKWTRAAGPLDAVS